MGIVEDKVIKNHYAAEYVYNAYKNTRTCGVIEEDTAYGIKKIAEPIGLIAAVIPTTNPTSTAIFKTLIALKTRNAIIISPHPRAKKCTIDAAKVVLEAAVEAGAPEGIIGWIDVPSLDLTNQVMREADIILATGGPGMLKLPILRKTCFRCRSRKYSCYSLMTVQISVWQLTPSSIPRPLTMV